MMFVCHGSSLNSLSPLPSSLLPPVASAEASGSCQALPPGDPLGPPCIRFSWGNRSTVLLILELEPLAPEDASTMVEASVHVESTVLLSCRLLSRALLPFRLVSRAFRPSRLVSRAFLPSCIAEGPKVSPIFCRQPPAAVHLHHVFIKLLDFHHSTRSIPPLWIDSVLVLDRHGYTHLQGLQLASVLCQLLAPPLVTPSQGQLPQSQNFVPFWVHLQLLWFDGQ